MKTTIGAFALLAVLVGFAACAKYPVIANSASPAPTAQAPAPTR